MKWLFCSILLISSLLTFGQSKVKSFYFEKNFSEPTKFSQQQLSKFKASHIDGTIRILEINAFTDSTGTPASNDTLAWERLSYFVKALNPDQNVKLNAYGLQRPYVVPKTLNYRRVDIIYTISSYNERSIDVANNDSSQIVLPTTTENSSTPTESHLQDDPEKPAEEDPMKESLNTLIPFVINVQFKEGTAKILPTSYKEITKVAVFLAEHPELKAEIRGHVCCGKNMRISRNRAKAVYNRLRKAGIDKQRLSYVGRSNEEPLIFPEKTNSDRQTNRRVDVKFSRINP
jgi:outer membrane protein OmpA-like peptidoglycan-associated protein